MGAAREHVERGIELWNNGEFDELLKQWAPDGVEVTPVGTLTGTKAIGDNYRRQRAGYPDLHIDDTEAGWRSATPSSSKAS